MADNQSLLQYWMSRFWPMRVKQEPRVEAAGELHKKEELNNGCTIEVRAGISEAGVPEVLWRVFAPDGHVVVENASVPNDNIAWTPKMLLDWGVDMAHRTAGAHYGATHELRRPAPDSDKGYFNH